MKESEVADWEVNMFCMDFPDDEMREPTMPHATNINQHAQDLIDFQRDKKLILSGETEEILQVSVDRSAQQLMIDLDKLGCEAHKAEEYFRMRKVEREPQEGDVLMHAINQTVDKPFQSGWNLPDVGIRWGL